MGIISKINTGVNISLVSDAGTPGISDPGFLLIRECIKNDINIISLPGPTACITALIQSGLPTNKFNFEGFLPLKKGRKKLLKQIFEDSINPTIIYESKHRILKTLKEFSLIYPYRKIVVLKELTKLNEKVYRGTIIEVLELINNATIKGEFVIVLDGNKE